MRPCNNRVHNFNAIGSGQDSQALDVGKGARKAINHGIVIQKKIDIQRNIMKLNILISKTER